MRVPSRYGLHWKPHSLAYARALTCKASVQMRGISQRVDQVTRNLAREDWQELSAGTGSKGPRLEATARIELAAPEAGGW